MQQAEEYTAKHYHQPSDEYHADMDFTRRCGDGALRIRAGMGGSELSSKLVGWQKGDEFEAARMKSAGGVTEN